MATAFSYLGIAVAVSVFLAFPHESAVHNFVYGGKDWIEHSCDSAVTLLNLGFVVQALLASMFVFVLPGAGSILGFRVATPGSVARKTVNEPAGSVATTAIAFVLLIFCPFLFLRVYFAVRFFALGSTFLINAIIVFEIVVQAVFGTVGIIAAVYLLRERLAWRPVMFFVAGWLFAALVPVVWWYAMRDYASHGGLCEAIFTATRPADFLRTDDAYDFYRYYVYLSVFSTAWVGTTVGALRWQATRAVEAGEEVTELRLFRNFLWVFVLGWAVEYRFGQWLTEVRPVRDWLGWSLLEFVYLTASSLWALVFVRSFWALRLRTWWASVGVAFAGTYLICIVTMLTFFWLFTAAPMALLPLYHWNVAGAGWALVIGTWRWSSLQKLQRARPDVEVGPRQGQAALTGLRALQIVALGFAGLLLCAMAFTAFYWLVVFHGPYRR